MKTPWSNLVQYGVAVATLVVVTLSGIILLAVVGTAIVLTKILTFIE